MSDLTRKNTCVMCGGREDRPGLWRCEEPCHPTPTLAQRIVAGIERDFRGRRGTLWLGVDEEIQVDIRDRWAAIVEEELTHQRWTLTGPPWHLQAL